MRDWTISYGCQKSLKREKKEKIKIADSLWVAFRGWWVFNYFCLNGKIASMIQQFVWYLRSAKNQQKNKKNASKFHTFFRQMPLLTWIPLPISSTRISRFSGKKFPVTWIPWPLPWIVRTSVKQYNFLDPLKSHGIGIQFTVGKSKPIKPNFYWCIFNVTIFKYWIYIDIHTLLYKHRNWCNGAIRCVCFYN